MVSLQHGKHIWRGLTVTLLLLFALMPAVGQSRVEAIMAGMTLEQKVAQMFLVGIYGPQLNEPNREMLRQWQPGGAVLFVSNVGTPDRVTALINEWQSAVTGAGGVPMFVSTDQEGGVIARLKDGFTTYPAMMLLTATGDVSLAVRTGEAMARELSGVGINMNLAPVADLYTNLRNPIIGRRSFGSEPERTGQMLAGLIRGMQGGGVMATAKHFPGHGDTDSDSHTSLPVVSHSREELDRVEFAPFRWTIAAGVEAVMVAHIWYPALDPDAPIPSSMSRNVVTGLLREEMAFDGLIMTDAIEMDAIDTTLSYAEASIRAIEAGIDIVAFGAHLGPDTQAGAMQAVVDAVRAGRIPEERINESVRRILGAKARYGVLDWTPLAPESAAQRVDMPAGTALVGELFAAGVTIAYDQIDALPLPQDKSVALIYPASRPSIRTYCEGHPNVTWIGVAESPSSGDIARAAGAARNADIAVVFTINAGTNREQQSLVNALPPEKTAAVALFSPFDWMTFPGVAAYMTTYSPLPESIPAACAVLLGQIPARGSLPVALDGARDFVNGGAQIGGGVALALIPRNLNATPVYPSGTTVALNPLTPNPSPSQAGRGAQNEAPPTLPGPTATPTFEPLQGGTRVAVVLPAVSPEASPTAAEIAPLTPIPEATVVAILPPPITPHPLTPSPTRGEGEQTAVLTPSTAFSMTPEMLAALIPMAVVAGIGVTYGSFYMAGARSRSRFARGFIIERCPCCGGYDLNIKASRRRVLGIPKAKHAVRCESCGSVLRESGGGVWHYTISEFANPMLYARFNDKNVDEKTLRLLERER
jgi:beta-N-acetylhexosaminidase